MIPLSVPSVSTFLYYGVVEDINDPEQIGRVRVRVIGVHTDNTALIPTEDLPWSEIFIPATSAGVSGIGMTPIGLQCGSMVVGIYKDADDRQEFVVLWTTHGKRMKYGGTGFSDPEGTYPKKDYGNDTNALARGDVKQSGAIDNKNANRMEKEEVDPNTPTPEVDVASLKDAPWMKVAMANRGVNEKDNPAKVREFHKVGGGQSQSEDVPWCSSFTNWCLGQVKVAGTRSAWARSFLKWGKSTGIEPKKIPYGAILVFRGSRGSSSGHVCFCVEDQGDRIMVIGGNQSTDGSTKYDDGGRVTQVRFKRDKLLDARWPA